MSVVLKQKTWADKDGRAVPEGSEAARFLVGPEGAQVSNDQATALGLIDGALPTPKVVEARERELAEEAAARDAEKTQAASKQAKKEEADAKARAEEEAKAKNKGSGKKEDKEPAQTKESKKPVLNKTK